VGRFDINRYFTKYELYFTPDFPTGRIADNHKTPILKLSKNEVYAYNTGSLTERMG
jgi:hypothetical protein